MTPVFCVSIENVFQYTAGASGLRGCKECCQEEHDRWSQGQRTHTQRSGTLLLPCFHIPSLCSILLVITSSCPLNTPYFLRVSSISLWQSLTFSILLLLALYCRLLVPAHPLHTARQTWDHLDCAEEVRIWRRPGAHTGIPVPHVSADSKVICGIYARVRGDMTGGRCLNRTFNLLNQPGVLFEGPTALIIRVV